MASLLQFAVECVGFKARCRKGGGVTVTPPPVQGEGRWRAMCENSRSFIASNTGISMGPELALVHLRASRDSLFMVLNSDSGITVMVTCFCGSGKVVLVYEGKLLQATIVKRPGFQVDLVRVSMAKPLFWRNSLRARASGGPGHCSVLRLTTCLSR